MGISVQPRMQFNLSSLISLYVNMDSLISPFLTGEIDNIIRHLPLDKAPSPDGFNGSFSKKCWSIIKEDFYKLCQDFFDGCVNLESINGSFITLIPKTNNPETVNDFRPISLLNSSIMLLTNLLADWLQQLILQLLHANQYGFIRSRSIQDCIAWCFEFIHQCQQSRREIITLKLDFAKAFNTIKHGAILEVMKAIGFPNKWLYWI
jgi:hypothetical protein